MPERKAVRRVETPEAQGDDSWVKVRRFQVGEWLALTEVDEGNRPEAVKRGLELIRTHVVAWNWVDDDGAPLPQPGEDPSVIDRLTDEEVLCLMRVLQGPTESQLKN